MKTYLKRLKNHPGVEVAFVMTGLGGFAGIANESMGPFTGAVFGASVMGLVCWPIVLWTARTQPLSKEDETHEQR